MIEEGNTITVISIYIVFLHWWAETLVIFATDFAIYFRLPKLSINKIIAIKFIQKINDEKLVL